ncbi:hypothetical protein COV19_00990 [Candidatus Woesearchaeota archaeon CG10_big_fil_rev_8_21_14_0_10_44_13]|nr:MAG: hypothetical protein COV19_00990 [Candidatus Woesearchaeota archaeon CG10_big_fil_rev_8_21_14_0_10_44_13]
MISVGIAESFIPHATNNINSILIYNLSNSIDHEKTLQARMEQAMKYSSFVVDHGDIFYPILVRDDSALGMKIDFRQWEGEIIKPLTNSCNSRGISMDYVRNKYNAAEYLGVGAAEIDELIEKNWLNPIERNNPGTDEGMHFFNLEELNHVKALIEKGYKPYDKQREISKKDAMKIERAKREWEKKLSGAQSTDRKAGSRQQSMSGQA